MYEPRHTIKVISDATGIPGNTLRTWSQRAMLRISLQDGSKARVKNPELNGQARLYSANSAIMFAIVGALVRQGVSFELAAQCAREFANTGDDFRNPGQLVKNCTTLAIVAGQHTRVLVVPDNEEFHGRDFIRKLLNISPQVEDGCSLVDLNEIAERTVIALNEDYQKLWGSTFGVNN
jgi:hypothetical protein